MIALAFPWVLALLIAIVFITLLKKRFVVSGIIVVFALLLNCWCECVALHFFSCVTNTDARLSIKVMTWNIDGSEYDSLKVRTIVDVINEQNPDAVYLAEDFNLTAARLDQIVKTKYPYSTFPENDNGHVFYSKYPLVDVRIVEMEDYALPLRVHCRIIVDSVTMVIYGCHLASNNYTVDQQDFHIDSVINSLDAMMYLRNIKTASMLRVQEVDAILADMEQNVFENLIVMGDFNDVAGSEPLRKLSKAGFFDAWWKGGIGYGATIHHPLPYRIDHVMYKGLKLKSIKKINADGLSDHDALVAEFFI